MGGELLTMSWKYGDLKVVLCSSQNMALMNSRLFQVKALCGSKSDQQVMVLHLNTLSESLRYQVNHWAQISAQPLGH